MKTFPWYAAELFLRVCEAGGISAASRFGKIGISQPAISAQMMMLEDYLGVQLFQRKPFLLTEEGERFQEEVLRLRSRMGLLCDSLLRDAERPLRIAASDVIIRDYLPGLLKQMDVPTRMRLVLREAASQDLAGLVKDGEADLAIGMLSKHVRIGSTPLVENIARLPIVLLIPPSHANSISNWSDVIKLLRQKEKPRLVSLPQNNLLMQHIQTGLHKARVEWHPTLEVSSLSHIAAYVELDFGFGFAIKTPHDLSKGSRVSVLDLSSREVAPLDLGVWHGERLEPLALKLLSLIRQYARESLQ